jgi:nicotinate-nucleotide adenylyltransferase
MKRLRLDAVWWLVSPGNPLKSARPRSLAERIAAAVAVADHPRIAVSAFEASVGTRYTVDTLRALRARAAGARLVWIMGADNLGQFHRWRDWKDIAALLPIAVIDRGTAGLRALASPAAAAMSRSRVRASEAGGLADRPAPAWSFLPGMKLTTSSTALRAPDGTWIGTGV